MAFGKGGKGKGEGVDRRIIAQRTLERLPLLPCKVEEMTEREYEIYKILSEVIGALQMIVEKEEE